MLAAMRLRDFFADRGVWLCADLLRSVLGVVGVAEAPGGVLSTGDLSLDKTLTSDAVHFVLSMLSCCGAEVDCFWGLPLVDCRPVSV